MLAEVEERFKVRIREHVVILHRGFLRSEDGKIDYSEFVSWGEGLVVSMLEGDEMKEEDLKQLFDLLDRDEDDYLEFSDILAFVFSLETELSDEEKRI